MSEQDAHSVVNEIVERVRQRLHTELPLPPADEPPASAAPAEAPAAHPNGPLPPDAIRTPADLAPYIDHTLLKADATREDVLRLAEEAKRHGFATVCVNPCNVATAARALAGSSTLPIAVVGFPLGATLPSAKAFEAREAVAAGAREIDMVIALGALKARDYARVLEDIAMVVEAARPVPVKVILETSLLTDDEKRAGCVLAKAGGAAFVKTSTGFGGGGATAEDVALLRSVVGSELGVKASGGIRSFEDALKMVQAGANRLGASASVAIVSKETSNGTY